MTTSERRAGTSPIKLKPGQSLAAALAARTPKDFAVEFGEYLAKSAERFMAAINSLDSAREGSDQSVSGAEMECNEAYRRLKNDIYEFRKRKDRI